MKFMKRLKDTCSPLNLGLAYRAKKLVHGTENSLTAIKSKQATLVIIAADASANTIKKITDKAQFYQIDYLIGFETKILSKAIGKSNIKVVSLLDEGFKKMFI